MKPGCIRNRIQQEHTRKEGEQQKIIHKGTKEKVNAFITLLYPYNGIKFNTTGKTRNSRRYLMKRNVKRFILVIDNASFHVSKKSTNYIKRQSEWLTAGYLPKRSPFLNPVETKVNRNPEERYLCKLLL